MYFLSQKQRNNLIFPHTLIIFLIIIKTNSYIVLPFKTTNIEINLNDNSKNKIDYFIKEINKNQLYTILSFGSPPKDIEFFLTSEKSFYAILSNFCFEDSLSTYNPNLSENFKSLKTNIISYGSVNKGSLVRDNCSFFIDTNLTKYKKVDNFCYLFGNYSNPENKKLSQDKFCGVIGITKENYDLYFYDENFIIYLKKEKIIDSYSCCFLYFDKENSYNINESIKNKYDGFYIIGINEKDYFNIFNTRNIKIGYFAKSNHFDFFGYNFDKIFFYDSFNNEIICSNNTLFEVVLDYNYILSDKEYFNKIKKYFFEKFLENKICIEEDSDIIYGGQSHLLICNINIKENLEQFPNLYFFNRELSFTFNLDYKDVFYEQDNKIYFLIIGKDMSKNNNVWRFGKIFMKKYPFIFDIDKKTISFIHLDKFGDGNNHKKNKNKIKNNYFIKRFKDVFLYSLLFIGILIGLFIGKRIWNKQRKLKANELEEQFDYASNNNKFTKIIE